MKLPKIATLSILLLTALLAGLGLTGYALAHPAAAPQPQASPLHPSFALLDSAGANVLESSLPVSTMQTCGQCHDTEFIASHSAHTTRTLGLPPDWITNPEATLPLADNEMACFLCHTTQPDNSARLAALSAGQGAWANTASLLASGVVTQTGETFSYNQAMFDEQGLLTLGIQDPTNENCGQCHGVVHSDLEQALLLDGCSDSASFTATSGQIISPARLKDSGLNLADKSSLTQAWDVHAERGLSCTDCHYAANNPVYQQPDAANQPQHLTFDPRRLELGEYLQRPEHNFARSPGDGQSGECESCHSLDKTHDWLPYKERHVQALACETCHAPRLNAPALQLRDATVLAADGSPISTCRGLDGDDPVSSLVTGYEPVLLPRAESDGSSRLAPFNLITTYTWVSGEPAQPVALETLQAAYLSNGGYAPEVLAAFDANANGTLEADELRLDTPAKHDLIAGRLAAQGISSPRVSGQVRAYPINHSLVSDENAVQDCQSCHSRDSRLTTALALGGAPGGDLPQLVNDGPAVWDGEIVQAANGQAAFQPDPSRSGLYIMGRHSIGWIDGFGAFFFVAVLLGIGGHATLRVINTRKRPAHAVKTRPVYMYAFYERLWHWLQTFTILGLLFTGLIIHKPDIFALFSFRGVVLAHNVLAALLVSNAALSLFYHLASGEIRQYIPHPRGFIDQAMQQTVYYLRGIFKGGPHPFEKTPDKKLNPLQQATYFGLLNVLLPAQVLTGALMWGRQQWPDLANMVGGLPFLAPLHTLISWLFAAFILGHVYLTTTGHTPLAAMEAMIGGWEDMPVAEAPAEHAVPPDDSDPNSNSLTTQTEGA